MTRQIMWKSGISNALDGETPNVSIDESKGVVIIGDNRVKIPTEAWKNEIDKAQKQLQEVLGADFGKQKLAQIDSKQSQANKELADKFDFLSSRISGVTEKWNYVGAPFPIGKDNEMLVTDIAQKASTSEANDYTDMYRRWKEQVKGDFGIVDVFASHQGDMYTNVKTAEQYVFIYDKGTKKAFWQKEATTSLAAAIAALTLDGKLMTSDDMKGLFQAKNDLEKFKKSTSAELSDIKSSALNLSNTVNSNKKDADTKIAEAKMAGDNAMTSLNSYKKANATVIEGFNKEINSQKTVNSTLRESITDVSKKIDNQKLTIDEEMAEKLSAIRGEIQGTSTDLSGKIEKQKIEIDTDMAKKLGEQKKAIDLQINNSSKNTLATAKELTQTMTSITANVISTGVMKNGKVVGGVNGKVRYEATVYFGSKDVTDIAVSNGLVGWYINGNTSPNILGKVYDLAPSTVTANNNVADVALWVDREELFKLMK